MIRHYGFYQKRMIRHYVIHPTKCMSRLFISILVCKLLIISGFFTRKFEWWSSKCCLHGQHPRKRKKIKNKKIKTNTFLLHFASHGCFTVVYLIGPGLWCNTVSWVKLGYPLFSGTRKLMPEFNSILWFQLSKCPHNIVRFWSKLIQCNTVITNTERQLAGRIKWSDIGKIVITWS